METTGTIFYKSTQILAYVDDIYIIGLRLSYVAEGLHQCNGLTCLLFKLALERAIREQGNEQVAENLGLQINKAKAKLMVATSVDLPISNQSLRRCDVQIGESTFEVVPEFTYLGSKVSNDNSLEAELRARRLATNWSFYNLKNQFTSENLSRRTKLGI